MLDFFIITIAILLITVWIQSKPFYWRKYGIPYSVPLPLLGSMAPAFFGPFRNTFINMYSKVGDAKAFGFHFFRRPSLLITDPELIKRVTINENENALERGFFTADYDPMGKGLFFAGGEEWREFRHKMTPYFTPARIKGMMPYVQPIGERFTQHLADEGKLGPVDVHDASMKMAVDVVMATIFGLKPDAFDNKDSFFFGLQKDLVSFIFGFKTLIGNLMPYVYNLLGLTILTPRANEQITHFVHDVIDQRLKGIGTRMDFVQGMVELMQKEEAKDDQKVEYNPDGTMVAKFNRFCITGQCALMYLAGTETTGNTLSFLLYELAMNPEIQQTARDEIVAMIQRTNNKYGLEDFNGLHYVHMVLKETLRKYPVLVIYGRNCTRSFKLDGIDIPKNTIMFIAPICFQNDPKYFPEPEKFLPERFADDNIVPGTYAPFGLGPRTCIGMKFAQTEIYMALCKLLPKYKLSPSNKTDVPMKFNYNPTLCPANGIWLNIEEIK